MNLNFRKAACYSALVTLPITGLISCDSANTSKPLETSAAVLASTATSEPTVITGDAITYFTNDFSDPFISGITFAGSSTTIGESTYEYITNTGDDHIFLIEVDFDASTALKTALDNVITGKLGAQFSSRIRQLLIRPEPANFTTAELTEIIQILNAGGANLQINDTNDGLRVPLKQTYTHLITSTVQERFQGSIGGVYKLESIGSEIIFRVGTDSETAGYRLFENGLLPVISSNQFLDSSDEKGTFVLEFENPATG